MTAADLVAVAEALGVTGATSAETLEAARWSGALLAEVALHLDLPLPALPLEPTAFRAGLSAVADELLALRVLALPETSAGLCVWRADHVPAAVAALLETEHHPGYAWVLFYRQDSVAGDAKRVAAALGEGAWWAPPGLRAWAPGACFVLVDAPEGAGE